MANVGMVARRMEGRHHRCCHCDGVLRDEQVVSPMVLQQEDGWPGFAFIDVVGDVDNGREGEGFPGESEPVGLLSS